MRCSLESAINAINESLGPKPSERDELIGAKCRGLMAGYHARWNGAPYEIDGVEQVVSADLWNPATQAKSRTFTIAGKLDITLRYQGERVILDHKTTSEDITDPNSPYWRQLVIDTQASHYMLLEHLNGRKAAYALWDVVRKPSIRPAKISAAEIKTATFSRTYCGQPLSDVNIAAMQATGRETIAMYEARLTQDCVSERPNWYFGRRMVPRLDDEILDYATDLWADGQEIMSARKNHRHSRNPGACLMYGRPCKYLGICSGHDSPDSDNWSRKAWMHKELPVIAGDGRDVLTNSRLKSFRTCHKLHYFDYEMGLERVDEDEAEALYFGSLMHLALEQWFLSSKQGEATHDASSYSYSVNGADSASENYAAIGTR